MPSLFSLQVLYILDFKVLDFFVLYSIDYFGVVFYLVFQTCKNYHTYVLSKESSVVGFFSSIQGNEWFLFEYVRWNHTWMNLVTYVGKCVDFVLHRRRVTYVAHFL